MAGVDHRDLDMRERSGILAVTFTRRLMRLARAAFILIAAAACARPQATTPALPPGAEAMSLLGRPLVPPPLPAAARERFEAQLAESRAALTRNPDDVDAAIWVGRRLAYLGRYREAIAAYTEAIARHPRDARLYRHRGHRYITVRELGNAVADLERAAALVAGRPDEVEPDGIPNARNIPTSTLQSNIWYHLGLAHYLRGDFAKALDAYRRDLAVATNPDMQVAVSHWLYMTLRRMGRDAEAAEVLRPISRDMEIIENGAYHRLLLMYRGELPPDSLLQPGADGVEDATVAYGVANWHLYNGRRAEARRLLDRVVEGPQWAAFGYIAAEAELARWAVSQQ